MVSSMDMLQELVEVLSREKFQLTNALVNRYVSIYAGNTEIVSLNVKVRAVAEDPDDDIVLGTATNGNADYLITGDRHLLALKEFRGTKIVTVDRALKIVSQTTP